MAAYVHSSQTSKIRLGLSSIKATDFKTFNYKVLYLYTSQQKHVTSYHGSSAGLVYSKFNKESFSKLHTR